MFEIIFSTVLLLAAILITTFIVTYNRDMYGRTPLGWWIVGIGISQMCVVIAFAVLWKEWWEAHRWIIYVSGCFAIAAVILGMIAKMYGSKH